MGLQSRYDGICGCEEEEIGEKKIDNRPEALAERSEANKDKRKVPL